MKKSKTIYTKVQCLYSLLLALALAWLTVSMPFVYAAQQTAAASMHPCADSDDGSNGLPSSAEEKSENGTASLTEYLHAQPVLDHAFGVPLRYYKCHPSDLYFAFHPDLLSPPPDRS